MSKEIEIREAKPGDEHELIELFRALYKKSDFLLIESGEFNLTTEKQAQPIEEHIGAKSEVLLVAETEE